MPSLPMFKETVRPPTMNSSSTSKEALSRDPSGSVTGARTHVELEVLDKALDALL